MQGGAIRVFDGATLKITTCTFQQNSVEFVSEGFEVVLKLFPHKRRIVTCPPIGGPQLNSARIMLKLGAVRSGKSQLLLALLFVSIRAHFLTEELSQIFAACGGGHPTFRAVPLMGGAQLFEIGGIR